MYCRENYREYNTEKAQIWKALNDARLARRERKKEEKEFTFKCYTFRNEKYYKIHGMKGDYYIEVDAYHGLTQQHQTLTLYGYSFMGMKSLKCYVKKVPYTKDKLLISQATTRDYFRLYRLELEV